MKPTHRFEDANQLAHKPRHILVVEDGDHLWEFFKAFLAEASPNLTLTRSPDGFEALRLLREHQFDMVWTDIIHPGPSGLELLRWVRANQPTVPVIVVTGYPSDSSECQQALSLGASDCLSKGEDDFSKHLLAVLSRLSRLDSQSESISDRGLSTAAASGQSRTDEFPVADEPLAARLRSPDNKVRAVAVQEVAAEKVHVQRETIAQIMLTDQLWDIRALAAHALHRLENLASIPALTQALADPDFCVRSNAQHALASLRRRQEVHPLPAAPQRLGTQTVRFAYADLGAGSQNLSLSCDLAGALDANIIYCVGLQQVTEAVSRTQGRFVLFTNFSLKERPPGQASWLNDFSETMRGLVLGCRPPSSPLDADPVYGPVRLFLFALLQCNPELHIHVITRAAAESVRDEDVLSLASAGRITIKRIVEFGVPTDYNAFIHYLIKRLRESYGRDNFVRSKRLSVGCGS